MHGAQVLNGEPPPCPVRNLPTRGFTYKDPHSPGPIAHKPVSPGFFVHHGLALSIIQLNTCPRPACSTSSIKSSTDLEPKRLINHLTSLPFDGPFSKKNRTSVGNTPIPPKKNQKKLNGSAPDISSNGLSSYHQIRSRCCPRKGANSGK